MLLLLAACGSSGGGKAQDAGGDSAIDSAGSGSGVCATKNDCPGGQNCLGGMCEPGTASCKAILAAHPATPDGDYWITPTGSAPILVRCDMTTSGGGWTALPLQFAVATMWDTSETGTACTTLLAANNLGHIKSFQSVNTTGYSYRSLKFVPPIAVSAVRFVQMNFRTGGSMNSMDIEVDGLPGATGYEGWYFSDGDATASLGFVYGPCNIPPYAQTGTYCNGQPGDAVASNALVTVDRTMTLTTAATHFQMVLAQNCASSLATAPNDGEGFEMNNPADTDGIWRTGIFVR